MVLIYHIPPEKKTVFEKIKVFLDKFPDSYIIIGLAVCRHILALIVE